MKKTCKGCEQRDGCVALCADVESEVAQDHAYQREQLHDQDWMTDERNDEDVIWDWQPEKIPPKKLKWLIIELHLQGQNECQIAYQLPCSQQYINRIIREFLASQVFGGE